jgi:hypothetical protein
MERAAWENVYSPVLYSYVCPLDLGKAAYRHYYVREANNVRSSRVNASVKYYTEIINSKYKLYRNRMKEKDSHYQVSINLQAETRVITVAEFLNSLYQQIWNIGSLKICLSTKEAHTLIRVPLRTWPFMSTEIKVT